MKIVRKKMEETWEMSRQEDAKRIAGQTPTAGVDVHADIAYLPDGNEMHLLNIYRPTSKKGPLPSLINIHGGGWMYGDKDLNIHQCMFMAAQGYALMGMSYRLLPSTDLKGMVQDVFASLHWLEQHGAEHGFDLSKVFLYGDSAGGHLTGLVTCIQLSPKLQAAYEVKPVGFNFKAIAILHGVCDVQDLRFAKGMAGKVVNNEIQEMMFGKPAKKSACYGLVSLAQTATGLTLPPVMLVSSEADFLHFQSLKAQKFLQEQNASHEVLFWTNEQNDQLGHVFQVGHPDLPESKETNLAILDFFARS